VYIIVGFLSFVACENKEAGATHDVLHGHWALTYGELNGRESPALEKIYFDFVHDSLKTNFTTSEQDETSTYQFSQSTLIQKTHEPIEYQILQLSDSLLEMKTELRGYDFKLVLQKQ
jgi:hypothetical protein